MSIINNYYKTEIEHRLSGVPGKIITVSLILFIAVSLCEFVYSCFIIKDIYQAETVFIVTENNGRNSDINGSMKKSELYSVVIRSDQSLQPIIERLKTDMSVKELRSCIEVSTIGSQNVIKVSVKHTDPGFALEVVGEIINNAPELLTEKFDLYSVKAICDPVMANGGAPINDRNGNIVSSIICFTFGTAVLVVFRIYLNNVRRKRIIPESK